MKNHTNATKNLDTGVIEDSISWEETSKENIYSKENTILNMHSENVVFKMEGEQDDYVKEANGEIFSSNDGETEPFSIMTWLDDNLSGGESTYKNHTTISYGNLYDHPKSIDIPVYYDNFSFLIV